MSKIVEFPKPRHSARTIADSAWTDDEWREFMLDLHGRLCEAMNSKSCEFKVTLSIDDICELMLAIEKTVGAEHFLSSDDA